METEFIIQEITQGVNIWEGVRQKINRFGKRLIEGLLRQELLSHLGRRAYERTPHRTNSLYQRGVKSPRLVIHDGSQPMERGREFVYPHSRSQRCCFHKIANIQLHLEHRSHGREMLREAAHIYRAHSEG